MDASFSMEPEEMAQLVTETQRAWQALGRVSYGPTEAERNSFVFRRSLHFVRDLAAGDVVTPESVRSIRQGGGLPPKHLDAIIGMRVRQAVSRGTPVELGPSGLIGRARLIAAMTAAIQASRRLRAARIRSSSAAARSIAAAHLSPGLR
jgi:SAF domain-containing protein